MTSSNSCFVYLQEEGIGDTLINVIRVAEMTRLQSEVCMSYQHKGPQVHRYYHCMHFPVQVTGLKVQPFSACVSALKNTCEACWNIERNVIQSLCSLFTDNLLQTLARLNSS